MTINYPVEARFEICVQCGKDAKEARAEALSLGRDWCMEHALRGWLCSTCFLADRGLDPAPQVHDVHP